jgi:hypothetical protein
MLTDIETEIYKVDKQIKEDVVVVQDMNRRICEDFAKLEKDRVL